MRVLGIDPGLGCTGYALVDQARLADKPRLLEAGALRAKDSLPLAERVLTIYRDLREVLEEFEPQVLGLESLYSEYRHPRAALQMAHVRGVVCLAAAESGIEVIDIAPGEVKNALCGAGRASKEQVQRTVQALYALDTAPHPADVADALAIATAVAYRCLLRDMRAPVE